MKNYIRLLLLLIIGIFFCGAAHSKTEGIRINNTTLIPGLDDYIWQNGVYPQPPYGRGGAINNDFSGIIGFITNSDFINNSSVAYGGAMENYGKIGTMTNLNFIGNSTARNGGAFSNTIGNSVITLINNSQFISNTSLNNGGAIYNGGTISSIDNTLFSKNNVKDGKGGAISSAAAGINISNSTFTQNSSKLGGGAISNFGNSNISVINSLFTDNTVRSGLGGAIANYENAVFTITDSSFTNNTAAGNGGAIANYNDAIFTITNSPFTNNTATAGNGGAIANYDNAVLTITNSSFINNTATTGNGGAIANMGSGHINFNVNGKDIVFDNNRDSQNLSDYYAEIGTTNNFNITDGSISFGGSVSGQEGWLLNVNGNNNSTINFNHNFENADMIASGVTINTSAENLINNSFDITSSSINIKNMGLNNVEFRSFKMNNSDMSLQGIDVNLNTKTMGKFSANTPIDISGGSVNVGEVTVSTDTGEKNTDIAFADMNWADKVRYNAQKILAPIFEYDSSYNPNTGNFNFKRTEKINSSVRVSNVANLANSILIEEIYSKVLNDTDRAAFRRGDDVRAPSYKTWVKAFNTNDDVSLKNFKAVDTEFNGILAGINSEKIYIGNCWDLVASIYGAYVEGEQNYDTSKITQTGEYLGASLYAHRGNFFTGFTTNIGSMRNQSTTMYGRDKYDTILGGFALKSGLDIPVFDSTIIQPNLLFSYTYIDTENYINPAIVHIHSDALDVIQVSPGVKFLQKLPYSTDIYFDVRYVKSYEYNGDVRANNIILPSISLKSYFEYGLGIQKNWVDLLAKHSVDSFVQISHRDGGREGWSGLMGLKVAF